MKGSLSAFIKDCLVGNQTEQILGWHLGNLEKWAGFTLTALKTPKDPEEQIQHLTIRITYHGMVEV